jgi:hypothetical protein
LKRNRNSAEREEKQGDDPGSRAFANKSRIASVGLLAAHENGRTKAAYLLVRSEGAGGCVRK